MTRESKIGLLVGLGFIIVIGILLSEQVTRSSEPAAAALDSAAASVRAATAAPGAGVDPASIEVAALAASIDGSTFGPSGVVPTQIELLADRRPKAPKIVAAPPADLAPAPTPTTVVINPPVAAAVESSPTGGSDAWDALAAKFDTPIVKVNAGPSTVAPADALFVPAGPPASASPARPTVVEYVVRPGDTLGRLAAQALGADSTSNRAAIVALNPALSADPNLLLVGVAYRLPAPPPTRYTVAVADVQPNAPARQPQRPRTYTVQPGDSLWRIAQTQAGGGSAVATIQSLNVSVLNGSDVVHPGMVLRLP